MSDEQAVILNDEIRRIWEAIGEVQDVIDLIAQRLGELEAENVQTKVPAGHGPV